MRTRSSACGAIALAALALAAPARADVTHPHPGLTLVNHPGQDAMVIVDLCADGVSIRATKYAERKGTPQQWGQLVGAQAAMNADFFDFPGWTYVVGRARGAGEEWPANAQQKEGRPYWGFGPGLTLGHADGGMAPTAGVTEIIGGHNVIISGGNTTGPWSDANDGQLLNTSHARSAVGASADRRTLFMMSTTSSISCSIPAADIDALVLGPPLRARPTLVKGSGPAVYLLDDDLTAPPAITGAGGGGGAGGGFASGGGGKGGSGGSGGGPSGSGDTGCNCRAAGAPSSGAGLGAGLAAVIAIASLSLRRGRRAGPS